MRSEDKTSKKNEPKNPAPRGKVRFNTKAAQHRHERRLSVARQARSYGKRGGKQAQDKIDKKAATRRRMASYTPAVRAERSAAGREHRKPRK